jgi:hypothetical protein
MLSVLWCLAAAFRFRLQRRSQAVSLQASGPLSCILHSNPTLALCSSLAIRLLIRDRMQLPLAELASAFYSNLKSQTSGYATFDYEPGPHRSADLVRLDFLIHGSPVDALSRVLHREDALPTARSVCKKLVSAVSRQSFEVRSRDEIHFHYLPTHFCAN